MSASNFIFIYGAYHRACDHRISKHFEDYYTLQYMDAGAVEVQIDNDCYALNGHSFWSAWPGPHISFHAARGQRTWVHRYVAFRGTIVNDWKRAGLYPIIPQRAPSGGDYAERFDFALRQLARGDDWGIRRGRHALEGMLIELAEARALGDHNPTWLAEVIRHLQTWVHEGHPNYEALAASLNISISTLRRQFKRATGVTPHDYLIALRVAAARQMLAESPTAIKEIARRLGYQDVFYFSRQFRAMAGVSPAAYRRSTQG